MKLCRTMLAALIALTIAGAAAAASEPTSTFLASNYYLLSLGLVTVEVDALRAAAQTAGYSIVSYDGDVPQAFHEGEPVDSSADTVLFDEQLLVIDGDRFLLRDAADGFRYTVRPGIDGATLVIDPSRDLPMGETLDTALTSLQSLGIIGNEVSFEVESFPKSAPKPPPPPQDASLDSTLYGLLVARDWFDFAAAHALALVGLRVEVVAELLPEATLAAAYEPYVTGRTDGLVKLQLPIDLLVALARSEAVGYVREPYRPSVP